MQNALLVGILVVLVVILIYKLGAARNGSGGGNGRLYDKFCPNQLDPRVVMSKRINSARGNPDAKPLVQSRVPGTSKYFQSASMVKPEDISSSERSMWFAAAEKDRIAPYNFEKMTDPGTDLLQSHETALALDYNSIITDLVVDPRTRENHEMWVNEMKGWSGTTTMKVDDLEMENYINFTGLARPQAGVTIYNPMMLTEIDNSDLARNKAFHFNG